MNDRPFDRITDAFLASGPVVLPDRVLDAAFEEVRRTRQRRVLWRAPWRFPIMDTYPKVAVAAVAVIAVGLLGLNVLGANQGDVGATPSATPSATPTPTTSPTATPPAEGGPPALTGAFTSPTHGYAISYPEGWTTRAAPAPWTTGIVDYFNAGSDLLMPGDPGSPFLALASQPLGDRTREQFEADYWQIMAEDDAGAAACPSAAVPITIDGATGVTACNAALVTDGGRGYVAMLWSSDGAPYDDAWFASVLATMTLDPAAAVDTAVGEAPPLTGQFTSPSYGYTISYPEEWSTRPATTAWTSGYVDFAGDAGDLLYEPSNAGNIWLALASQPLGDRTSATFEAEVWQALVDDDPEAAVCTAAAEPVTIDGAAGSIACGVAVVTDGGRGYYVSLYVSGDDPADALVYDDAWFASVLATMTLDPEAAVDAAP